MAWREYLWRGSKICVSDNIYRRGGLGYVATSWGKITELYLWHERSLGWRMFTSCSNICHHKSYTNGFSQDKTTLKPCQKPCYCYNVAPLKDQVYVVWWNRPKLYSNINMIRFHNTPLSGLNLYCISYQIFTDSYFTPRRWQINATNGTL